ncbi:ankyrin [Hypoxylon sp. FL1284]|nr:ankyrin [Hypoxylon sp. FL1284]
MLVHWHYSDRGRYVLQRVAELDDKTLEDRWPIHETVRHRGDLVSVLNESIEGINALDGFGVAPLHWAVVVENRTAIQTLIDYGANPDIPDTQGYTPLMVAVRRAKFECINTLLKYGCAVNTFTFPEMNTLGAALASPLPNTAKVAEILISSGARLVSYKHGNMLHFLASYKGAAEIEEKVHMLVGAGVDMAETDDVGRTPLVLSLVKNNFVMLRLLIVAGSGLDATPQTRTIRDIAYYTDARCMGVVEETKYCIDVRVRHSMEWTPLDIFEWRMYSDPLKLPGGLMPPSDDDVAAFNRLLCGVRDRYLTAEIRVLEMVVKHLKAGEIVLAREALRPVIQEKVDWNIPAERKTFRAVDVQIKEAMVEAAIESIEEFVGVSRARIGTDPFEGDYCRACSLMDKGLVVEDAN